MIVFYLYFCAYQCGNIFNLIYAYRTKSGERLADVSAADRKRRVCGRAGCDTGDDWVWRVCRVGEGDQGVISPYTPI